jgi:hypothetical protein
MGNWPTTLPSPSPLPFLQPVSRRCGGTYATHVRAGGWENTLRHFVYWDYQNHLNKFKWHFRSSSQITNTLSPCLKCVTLEYIFADNGPSAKQPAGMGRTLVVCRTNHPTWVEYRAAPKPYKPPIAPTNRPVRISISSNSRWPHFERLVTHLIVPTVIGGHNQTNQTCMYVCIYIYVHTYSTRVIYIIYRHRCIYVI